MSVVPVQSQPSRDLLDDPQILAGIAGRVQHPPSDLDLAVGVGDGAVLLQPGRGGQHHVGVARGFGQEQILHHQMVEARQGFTRVLRIRIRHGGVLAHDVHAADIAGAGGIDDLHHGQPAFGIQFGAPGLFEPRAGFAESTAW